MENQRGPTGGESATELKLAEIKSGDGIEMATSVMAKREGEAQRNPGGRNGARGYDRSNLGTAAPLDNVQYRMICVR